MECVVMLLIGMSIGSFLNVCIYRIPHEESILYPPSHCIKCKNKIKPYDLIPVISYILLKGRCRYCGEKISIRYPLLEILTGLVFVWVYFTYGISIQFVKFSVLICIFMVMGMIDFYTTDVYFKTIIFGFVIGSIFIVLYYLKGYDVITYLIGASIGGGFISTIILATKSMGWGDGEVCFLAGMYLGWQKTILMLFLSIVLCGVVNLVLIIAKKKSINEYIPFIPYIAISVAIVAIWGQNIMKYYCI